MLRTEGAVTLRYIHTTEETRSVRRGMIVFDRSTFSVNDNYAADSRILSFNLSRKKEYWKAQWLFHDRLALNFNYVIDYLLNVK